MAVFTKSDIAFVTGAGSGIGRATCILLAEQGATVVAVDINKTAADQTVQALKGDQHMSVQCDVTSLQQVQSAVSQVQARYSSSPNLAVNSAGIPLLMSLVDVTEEVFDRVFNINVKGTVWVMQAVCKGLLNEKRTGSIVNVASIGKEGKALNSIYGASKGAVQSFSFAVAKEMAPQGIRVNLVSPGAIETPMMQVATQEWLDDHMSKNPMRRLGKPEEVAETIVFLLSEKSSYTTGTNIYVHGGEV